jgi:uncharacterized protein
VDKRIRNLLIFFAATFVWTWGFYAPMALGHHSPYEWPWNPLLILGGMGPSLVGVALVLLTENRDARRDFFRRCFTPGRIGLPSWALILFTFPAILGLSIALDRATGGTLPGMEELKSLLGSPLAWPLVAFISFMSGPWSEEFGWRGYALDPLLARLGIFKGSVTLGVIWAVWHLPLYFMANTWHAEMGFKLAGFWTFIGLSVGLSLLMTWVYLSTNRSILAAMLLHFASNFTSQLFSPLSDRVEVTRVVLLLVVACLGCLLAVRRSRREDQRNAVPLDSFPAA